MLHMSHTVTPWVTGTWNPLPIIQVLVLPLGVSTVHSFPRYPVSRCYFPLQPPLALCSPHHQSTGDSVHTGHDVCLFHKTGGFLRTVASSGSLLCCNAGAKGTCTWLTMGAQCSCGTQPPHIFKSICRQPCPSCSKLVSPGPRLLFPEEGSHLSLLYVPSLPTLSPLTRPLQGTQTDLPSAS